MVRKRVIISLFLFGIILFLNNVSSLGVSPALKEYNFKPGLEAEITYRVFATSADMELELYVAGELAEYVNLDRESLVGGGSFTATLKLPEDVKLKPGKNRIYIGVKEKVDDELISSSIGTSVTIQVVILIHVPYPGRYLEVDLKSKDVNVNEPIDFELDIKSYGEENVIVTPKIEISSGDKILDVLEFRERIILSQELVQLKKTFYPEEYNPGNYKATAIVDYEGETAIDEETFRIGELIINILDYTKRVLIGKTSAFDLSIESGWNDKIDGAYAEVSFLDNFGNKILDFPTFTTNLAPWENKTITGYFDSSNFSSGFYDANITLIYFGKDVGKSENQIVKVEFVNENNLILIGGIILGVIVFGLVLWVVLRRRFKK